MVQRRIKKIHLTRSDGSSMNDTEPNSSCRANAIASSSPTPSPSPVAVVWGGVPPGAQAVARHLELAGESEVQPMLGCQPKVLPYQERKQDKRIQNGKSRLLHEGLRGVGRFDMDVMHGCKPQDTTPRPLIHPPSHLRLSRSKRATGSSFYLLHPRHTKRGPSPGSSPETQLLLS